MPNPGEHADVLRALGRHLDELGATGIEIVNHEVFLSVSWAESVESEQRAYQEHDLEALRSRAKLLRQSPSGDPGGSLAELLRTVGQELDRTNATLSGLTQEPDSFRLSGIRDGVYFRETYTIAELDQLRIERRAGRGSGPVEPPPRPALPQITLSAVVFTADGQRLGKVSEVWPRHFKVGTPLLRRDYWLPTDRVASVGAEGQVILTFNKPRLDQHRLARPPAES
jgi:hypothetical protein